MEMDNNYQAYIYETFSPDDGVHLVDEWFFSEVPEETVEDYFEENQVALAA